MGVQVLETDVQQTADGVAVAFHDDTLDRITDLRGPIRSFTWDELQHATVWGPGGRDADEPHGQLIRLDDLLAAFRDAHWAIDVKNEDSIESIAEAINATDSASRVCVAHAWDSWLEALREMTSPELQRTLGWQGLTVLIACARAGIRPPRSLNASWNHVGWRAGGIRLMKREGFAQRFIDMSHDLGIGVRVWTINKPKNMRRLLDQGADGIFTDRPDLALRVLSTFKPTG